MKRTTVAPDMKKERINSLTHGLGVLFGIIAIPVLLTESIGADDPAGTTGVVVYSMSFMMVFTFSTLFHFSRREKTRRVMEICDHISIYFLISGTYTPIVLIYFNNATGITILAVLWLLTIAGTLFKCFFTGRWNILSTFIYLAMGWILLSAVKSFFSNMPTPVIVLILAGAGLYSTGIIFYLWEKYTYSHAIWHSFVLLAAILHFSAIFISI